MAATSRLEDGGTPLAKAVGQAHPNSPINGSLATAQLVAEIGRCLRSQSSRVLEEPLPDELAILVRQLQEREQAQVHRG